MRIAGFLLGFLFLLSTGAGAQSTTQPAASQTESATSQTAPKASSDVQKERDNSGADYGHKLHLRLGPVFLGAGYSRFSGPGYYPFGPYDSYSLGWGPPFWSPWGAYPFFAPGYFGYGSAKGEVRLSAEPKTAEVYLDHAFAGPADHLKNMWLEPGAYDLSVSAPGHEVFRQRIYVLSGKSLKITARLAAEPQLIEGKDKP